MAQKSKAGIIGIILASLVVIASLVFLACVLKHRHHGHDMAGHDGMHSGMMHDGMHSGMMHDGMHTEMDEDGEGIAIEHSYARANGASAQAGAAFLVIKNFSDEDDRLIGAKTDVSKKAELHTHKMDANGMMTMGPIEGGLAVPGHSQVELKRGGNHVMMMGLTQSLNQGDVVTLTLTFEKAGEVIVQVPVDLNR
jgi:copper(I)-binding protein